MSSAESTRRRGRRQRTGAFLPLAIVTALTVSAALVLPGSAEAQAEPLVAPAVVPLSGNRLDSDLARVLRRYRANGEVKSATIASDGDRASFLVIGGAKTKSASKWLRTHSALLQPELAGVSKVAGAKLTLKLTDTINAAKSKHASFTQYLGKIPVYGSRVTVHSSSSGKITSVTNGLSTTLSVDSLKAKVTRRTAVSEAKKAAPGNSSVQGKPWLAVRDGRLVWVVDLRGDGFANRYFVSARAVPTVLSVEDRMRDGLNREIYDANNARDLPGTLVIREGGAYDAQTDAGAAYVNTGRAWAYWKDVFNRDSFDDGGATLISTVKYGSSYENAYWDGSQMVYGDGMATIDVTAHELTHALTEWTADLEYLDQSGALNESFSDIFAVMARRNATGALTWTIGDGSAVGVIRDLSDPTAYGQPDHLSNYLATCDDHGGVHTNSGIPNKAFYNAVQKVGYDKAQRTFYLALTAYLLSDSEFNDTRAATIQAATQLYGSGSHVPTQIAAAWDLVGVDGSAEPPEAECGCSVNAALAGATTDADPLPATMVASIRSSLYRFRDAVFGVAGGGLGKAYGLYTANSGALAKLLDSDPVLKHQAREALEFLSPAIVQVMEGQGSGSLVSEEMVGVVDRMRAAVIAKAEASGDPALAEAARVALPSDLSGYVGRSLADAYADVVGYWQDELR